MMNQEIQTKLSQLRSLLSSRGLQGILLTRVSSFAWITGGSSTAINVASSFGEGAALITLDKQYILANNIETTRLKNEEKLEEKGWEFFVSNWYEASTALDTLAKGFKLASDAPAAGMVDLGAEVSRLRAVLQPVEQDRFRDLGSRRAAASVEAIYAVRPGMSEFEIGSLLSKACLERGVEPIVNLIATDERIFSYRHPTYSDKKMDRYAMLVLCGRRLGLVASITRLVHFGALSAELQRKAEACARVDAAIIAATRPGRTLGQVFSDTQAAYAAVGFPNEWTLHHQGGPAGYEPREFVGNPTSTDLVAAGQAYAWNPSITGAKVEDTVLITESGSQVLTEMPGWPVYEIQSGAVVLRRPRILEVI
ncbi:MAG: M24 family metallopeptidase [Anaerolineae bacterium]|nr:M24 family metallopeptidase [Anaerolineae bacterium]